MIPAKVLGAVLGMPWASRAKANARLFMWLLSDETYGVLRYQELNGSLMRKVAGLYNDVLTDRQYVPIVWGGVREQVKAHIPSYQIAEQYATDLAVHKLLLFMVNDNPLEAIDAATSVVRLNFEKFAANPIDAQELFVKALCKVMMVDPA